MLNKTAIHRLISSMEGGTKGNEIMQMQKSDWNNLPIDIIFEISKHVNNPKDLYNFGTLCKRYSFVLKRESKWKNVNSSLGLKVYIQFRIEDQTFSNGIHLSWTSYQMQRGRTFSACICLIASTCIADRIYDSVAIVVKNTIFSTLNCSFLMPYVRDSVTSDRKIFPWFNDTGDHVIIICQSSVRGTMIEYSFALSFEGFLHKD
jgi:hypothetical protein